MTIEGEERDGFLWARKTVREIKEVFKFWGVATIDRIIQSLIKKGFVVIGDFDDGPGKGGRWVRFDFEKLKTLKSIVVDCSIVEQRMFRSDQESHQNGTTVLIDKDQRINTGENGKLKLPRLPGSDDDLDDKAPKLHYSVLKNPSIFGYDIIGIMSQMFPGLIVRGENGLYVQWSGKRIVSRGIGGRPRAKSTLREYAYDFELFLRKCASNQTNGNGYGNGAGKDAMSQSRFIAGPMSKEDRAEQMRVAAEFEDNIRRAGGKV